MTLPTYILHLYAVEESPWHLSTKPSLIKFHIEFMHVTKAASWTNMRANKANMSYVGDLGRHGGDGGVGCTLGTACRSYGLLTSYTKTTTNSSTASRFVG